jgi:HSP20 family protein
MPFDDRDDPFDDRNGPFDDFFEEIERMMESMTGVGGDPTGGGNAGFGEDTHIDVYEEDDTVRLVADLPGVEKDSLDLQCDGEILTIRAATDGREMTERVRLPARVDEHSAEATFNNGVLQVTFDRLEDSAAIDLD